MQYFPVIVCVGKGKENWRKKLCGTDTFISELQGRSWERWKGNLLPFGADQQLLAVAEGARGCSQWFLWGEEKEVTVQQTW